MLPHLANEGRSLSKGGFCDIIASSGYFIPLTAGYAMIEEG